MKSAVRFFCVAFLVAFLAQWALWQSVNFVDQSFWLEKIGYLAEDLTSDPLIFDIRRHPAHPGTLVLVAATAIHAGGFSLLDSLRDAVALLNAVIIAAILSLVRQLRPHSPWWLGMGGLLLFHPFYEMANPLDVIVSSLLVLIFLFLLLHQEKRETTSMSTSLALAFCLGAAAATRLHIIFLLVVPLLMAVMYSTGIRRAGLVGASALVVAQALNPFMWYSPRVFLSAAVGQQLVYFTDKTVDLSATFRLAPLALVTSSPLAIISLVLALVFFVCRGQSPLPRSFITTLLIGTSVVLSVFWLSNLQSYRYVFPVILVWETLLPLFVLYLIRLAHLPTLISTSVMALLSGMYILLFLYSLLLPIPVYI